MRDLSPAEQSVLLKMRQLAPFEVIEVKLNPKGDLVVVVKSTLHETFPVDSRV